jgi:hypothetical protein
MGPFDAQISIEVNQTSGNSIEVYSTNALSTPTGYCKIPILNNNTDGLPYVNAISFDPMKNNMTCSIESITSLSNN